MTNTIDRTQPQCRLKEMSVPDERRYVDVHCHCLPGIDDGPETLEESLLLCEKLVEDRISTVIATPHQLGRYSGTNECALIREKTAHLNECLKQRGIDLVIKPGGDVRVDERLCDLLKADQVMTLADGGTYILLELPSRTFLDIEPMLMTLSERGVRAVISHPERHSILAGHPEMMQRWLAYSVYFQVTAGSFLGQFGSAAQQAAWNFLEAGWCHLVATDAHHRNYRGPCLNAAFHQIHFRYGWDVANLLCVDNPRRVLEGIELNGIQSLRQGMSGSRHLS